MEKSHLLISDVDGTLLGNDPGLLAFANWYEEHHHQLALVYSSGRFPDSLRDSIANSALPCPDVLIGGVGTQMEWFETGEPVGNWPVTEGHWNVKEIRQLLQSFPGLTPQAEEFQSTYKLSYFAHNATTKYLRELELELMRAGFAVELVYSSQRDLDLLPKGINKGSAASFLAEFWKFPKSQVCVSGDSANDWALFQQGFCGIIVQNAHPELTALPPTGNFFASEDCAGGVLQGLQHWLSAENS